MNRHPLLASAAFAALVSAGPAFAAGCPSGGAGPIAVGQLQSVGAQARTFTVTLAAGDGIQADLTSITATSDGDDGDEHEGEGSGNAAPTGLMVCDASGKVLAPLPSEVFASGGSMSRIDDGVRLRFAAPAAGAYRIAVAAGAEERELLLRRRDVPAQNRTPTELELGGSDFAKVSRDKPLTYQFAGKAGQWVRITATSDNDTVLHLAGPGADGYESIADNDDSDGLNPAIRRRLPVSGTYYVQLESLSASEADASLLVETVDAPPPPPAPLALKSGAAVTGKLEDGGQKVLYALPVTAGHSYRLELTAPYDSVIEVGLDDPLVPEDDDGTGNGFSSVRSADRNLTGTEKLTFTARSTGRVLVQVRAYGLGESDGGYTLKAIDAGL